MKTSKELGDRARGEIARLRRFHRPCLAGALRGSRSLLRELEDGCQHLRLEHRLAEEVPHAQLERAPVELGRAFAAGHHHDWDAGCECRKPKPGMLFQAQREWSLDLTRTPFIGDDERDAEAAGAAGCPSVLVSADVPLLEIANKIISNS